MTAWAPDALICSAWAVASVEPRSMPWCRDHGAAMLLDVVSRRIAVAVCPVVAVLDQRDLGHAGLAHGEAGHRVAGLHAGVSGMEHAGNGRGGDLRVGGNADPGDAFLLQHRLDRHGDAAAGLPMIMKTLSS